MLNVLKAASVLAVTKFASHNSPIGSDGQGMVMKVAMEVLKAVIVVIVLIRLPQDTFVVHDSSLERGDVRVTLMRIRLMCDVHIIASCRSEEPCKVARTCEDLKWSRECLRLCVSVHTVILSMNPCDASQNRL